jgi:endonuclease/exonuclease/phosphatase family metal-dependent hydrolase
MGGTDMATNLRIATFNCENLFSRPKIFYQTAARSKALLGFVAELQEELKKEVFDQVKIKDLKTKLKGLAEINDLRGKHDKAGGAGEWLGTVELKRRVINDAAVANTARVIGDINADVICLIEVENRILLQKFHDEILFPQFLQKNNLPPYPYVMLIDGNDERGIDVSFISRLPLLWLRTHMFERSIYDGREVPTFSRDCLEVQFQLPNDRTLHLLINHFKSMGYSPKNDPQSNRRRRQQAQRVAELMDAHDLATEYLLTAGDFNSDPASPSLAPLVNKPGLYNVNLELPEKERGTYQTGNKQLDYLLVSEALKNGLQGVHIERRGVFTKKKWPHYPEVTSSTDQASDHAAVVADFQL